MEAGAKEPKSASRLGRTRGRRVYRFTADQALTMAAAGILPEDGSTELWNGVFYHVTKGETHNVIVHKLAEALRPLTPEGYHLRQESSTRRGEYSLPEPDVAVIAGAVDDYHPKPPPLKKVDFVVEVAATSDDSDFKVKLPAYAAQGIPTYWVVDVADRRVVVCTGPRKRRGGPASYDRQVGFGLDETIEVVIAGAPRGRVAVRDQFPRDLLA